MERVNCILIEDDVLEMLDEVQKQMEKGLICCKCSNPCEKNTRCAAAMKNLLTDIHMFVDAYAKRNEPENSQV